MDLNEAEWHDLDGLLDRARVLVEGVGLHVPDGALPAPEQMDRYLRRWAAEAVETRVHANDVVNAFGAALGAHLCTRLGLRWILVADEYGTDLAVTGQPNDILVFPIDATAKRFDRGEVGFLTALVGTLTDQVEAIRER